jgi:hypothetical protein
VFKDPAKVEALELRDPDPVPPQGGSSLGAVLDAGGWLLLPLGALLLAAFASRGGLPRPRPAVAASGAAALGLAGLAAVSVAQRSEPSSTPKGSLPNPARIWTTANRFVLAPAPSRSEDPRRNPRTQTHDGAFRARCPGNTRIVIRSGAESTSKKVKVPSRRGRIARRVRLRRAPLRRGRKLRIARVRLAQQAEVLARLRRRGRTLRTLRRGCFPAGRTLSFFWDGRLRRGGKLRRAARGRYRLEIRVRSDRPALRRGRLVRLR